MKEDLNREIELAGATAMITGSLLTVKGPKGEVKRVFSYPKFKMKVEGNKIVLFYPRATKKEKMLLGSFESHIINMVKGVKEPFVYKLKICSGHFPMSVSVSGLEFSVKNFLGESVPRKVTFIPGSEVKIDGVDITVTSPDKEVAGQNAAKIESLCRITNRDIRIFQDGCYMTNKAGKSI